ncbi:uracil-DNA glycosylase [Roseateles koreensis]|uniref:Uracil-DNA glycosylase n=1 Tax=Roseateles koreensis TaxID=2987526 RepID=A0ABT5KRW2_9BURK|nr:uracil-DNA glycosylase [Roseateles koreensis]MDC8784611.1 uracil-DNA glycosylase [Roseateles koreensis]
MTWDERQSAMLAAMGLRVWPRAEELADDLADGRVDDLVEVRANVQADESAVDLKAERAEAPVECSVDRPAKGDAPSPRVNAAIASMEALPPALREAGSLGRSAAPQLRPAVQALDWKALRAAAANCRACSLSGGSRTFGQGQAQAQEGMAPVQCLVVVDAAAEAATGEGADPQAPLNGEAAQLLTHLLRAMGLTLSGQGASDAEPAVFVTSPLKCRPQPGRSAGAAELQQCQPLLARQIELLQPKLILALGPQSIQSLLNTTEPLGRLRGRVHAYPHQGLSIPVVVSYHPAYLLRQQADKPRAWADLCLALTTLEAQP